MTNPHRPVYHYQPERGWMNDPNGLVFFRDRWHLFYQYYEPDIVDGMQWGHAISRDLLQWEDLPPALSPDRHGQIWSGSAVVDAGNTSGFFPGSDGMVCAFTYWNPQTHWQSQGIAYSEDGLHFTKYENNPVISELRFLAGHPADRDFRDPKIFWHEETSRWVMVVAGGKLRIFTSSNLREWEFASLDETIETECPDLFPLSLEGHPDDRRWVLVGAGRWYRVGAFDGRQFTTEAGPFPLSRGPDFYASQTWNQAPANRRVMISWLFGWNYGARISPQGIENPFATGLNAGGCLSFPLEVSLGQGDRLMLQPVRELAGLRERCLLECEWNLAPGESAVLADDGMALEIWIRLDNPKEAGFVLSLPNHQAEHRYQCGFCPEREIAYLDRTASRYLEVPNYAVRHEIPFIPGPELNWRILLDRNSLEIFSADGAMILAALLHPEAPGGMVLGNPGRLPAQLQVRVFRLRKP